MSRRDIKKVDTITHSKSGLNVEVTMDVRTKTFSARVLDQLVEAKSYEEVERGVWKLLDEAVVPEWVPVIEVTTGVNDTFSKTSGHAIDLKYTRYWIARQLSGQYMASDWRYGEDDPSPFGNHEPRRNSRLLYATQWYVANRSKDGLVRDADDKVVLPQSHRVSRSFDGGGVTHYLPYTDEMWGGLEIVSAKLREVREQLEALLSDPQYHEKIAGLGAAMLTLSTIPLLSPGDTTGGDT